MTNQLLAELEMANKEIERHFGEYSINKNIIEANREIAIKVAEKEERYEDTDSINSGFDAETSTAIRVSVPKFSSCSNARFHLVFS